MPVNTLAFRSENSRILLSVFFKLVALLGALCLRSELTEAQERELSSIFKQLWSPHCEARVLADCPTEESERLRNEIRALYTSGFSKEQIIDKMIEEYGEEILTLNTKSSYGLILLLIPSALLIAALGYSFYALRPQKSD